MSVKTVIDNQGRPNGLYWQCEARGSMVPKRTPLTKEQFDRLALAGWTIDDVPPEHWAMIPGLQRLHDTFAIMASGSVVNPVALNGINAIAGIDLLAQETRPMANEPPGNAYHYVIQQTSDSRFPYILHGPFKSETIVDHWFDADQLDRYWSCGTGSIGQD